MLTYIVIGICILLLLLVVYISAKPISMGIEARRNLKDNLENFEENNQNTSNFNEDENTNNVKISDEITKLNDLKNKGILTEQEYKKAKSKLLD